MKEEYIEINYCYFNFYFVCLQKLWNDLKSLLESVRDFTDMDVKLKNSLYNWGLNYV